MMAYNRFRANVIFLGVSLMALAGCINLGLGEGTQDPTKFYVLHSLDRAEAAAKIASLEEAPEVGVGPVKLPKYLNRPQIVTRVSPNEHRIAAFAQWVEPLRENVSRVLAENLTILLSTGRVVVYPWRRSTPPDVQVVLDITRFDAEPRGEAVLEGSWSLMDPETGNILFTGRSDFRSPVDGKGYEAIASAMSRTVSDLSRMIAEKIEGLPLRPPFIKGDEGGLNNSNLP